MYRFLSMLFIIASLNSMQFEPSEEEELDMFLEHMKVVDQPTLQKICDKAIELCPCISRNPFQYKCVYKRLRDYCGVVTMDVEVRDKYSDTKIASFEYRYDQQTTELKQLP